jgi:CRISPR-associated protein Cmr6
MYSGTKLVDALAEQHARRANSELFRSATFTLDWRSKVGSFTHPDGETIVSAGEPCGSWNRHGSRPEAKRNLAENLKSFNKLPLNGYVPAASIRGIVRAWVSQHPELIRQMEELFGCQKDSKFIAGKIEFIDAFPTEATKLTLDIANPQQNFQVFHTGSASPFSLYTLGDGREKIDIKVAIRGCRGASVKDVDKAWEWVKQALIVHGVGSRTASGYGALTTTEYEPNLRLLQQGGDRISRKLDFTLYSQGCGGIKPTTGDELRPTHWRGWLRSWVLRFFLGVMSQSNAELTVNELFGSLSHKGLVRLRVKIDEPISSKDNYPFYRWTGSIELSAPEHILDEIILPIIKIAVRVGGVGRGWRRPLHIVNNRVRGCYVRLTRSRKETVSNSPINNPSLISNDLNLIYNFWRDFAEKYWSDRYDGNTPNIKAEVFSPNTCAVYKVPGSDGNAIDESKLIWVKKVEETRGKGMKLIYDIENNSTKYKGNPAVGGSMRNCSWVSIQRENPSQSDSNCYEIVCIFMGDSNESRSQFLQDLANIEGAKNIFGLIGKK